MKLHMILAGAVCASVMASASAADHPRLIVDAKVVQTLRTRVKAEPYASMLKAVQKELATPDENAKSIMYNFTPRNLAALYLLTGEKKYAADAEKLCLDMVNDKEFWNNPGSKGLTRAAGALTVALAYDACYDAWPESTRTLVSKKLREASENLMKSMGAGANNKTANNWQGVRYGAAGTAALASDDGSGVETAKQCFSQLKRHLQENLGDNGWNPEGIGYTQYPWTFIGPFGIAAANNDVGDLRTEVKKASLTHWTCFAGTVAIPKVNGFGVHGDLSDDNPHWSGDGTASLGFFFAPENQRPAIKWMYDHLVGNEGDKTFDTKWGGGLYSILLYPGDTPAKNPAETIGLNYTDKSHGIAIFRNAFKDENDVVLLANAHSRQPQGAHGGPDTNTFRLIGLGSFWATGCGRGGELGGQTNMFDSDPSTAAKVKKPKGSAPDLGKLKSVDFASDGGGSCVMTGSSMGVENQTRRLAVDFSIPGTAAVIVSAETSGDGKFWRLNVPEFNTIKTSGHTFTITAPNGATLVGTVIEPAAAKLRTGTIARDNPKDDHGVGMDFRGKKYRNNNWVDFPCDKNALVVMTLQKGAAPKVDGKGTATEATLTVGGKTVTVAGDKITFGK